MSGAEPMLIGAAVSVLANSNRPNSNPISNALEGAVAGASLGSSLAAGGIGNAANLAVAGNQYLGTTGDSGDSSYYNMGQLPSVSNFEKAQNLLNNEKFISAANTFGGYAFPPQFEDNPPPNLFTGNPIPVSRQFTQMQNPYNFSPVEIKTGLLG